MYNEKIWYCNYPVFSVSYKTLAAIFFAVIMSAELAKYVWRNEILMSYVGEVHQSHAQQRSEGGVRQNIYGDLQDKMSPLNFFIARFFKNISEL